MKYIMDEFLEKLEDARSRGDHYVCLQIGNSTSDNVTDCLNAAWQKGWRFKASLDGGMFLLERRFVVMQTENFIHMTPAGQ